MAGTHLPLSSSLSLPPALSLFHAPSLSVCETRPHFLPSWIRPCRSSGTMPMAFSRVRTILACWCSARPSPPRAFIATAGTRTPDGCFSLVPGLWEMSRHLRNYGFVLSTFRNPFGANPGVRSGFPTGRALGLWSPTSTPVPGSGCAPPTRQVVAGSGPACEREARLLASLRPETLSPREGRLASRSRTEFQERPPRRPVRNSPLPPPSPSPRPPVRRWSR